MVEPPDAATGPALATGGGKICVEVVHALPEGYRCVRVSLAAGSTVADALAQAPELAVHADPHCIAVHGQRAGLDATLADGDRVELLRPLLADPRAVRRQRAAAMPRRRR